MLPTPAGAANPSGTIPACGRATTGPADANGSQNLPYKEDAGGSSPSAPTEKQQVRAGPEDRLYRARPLLLLPLLLQFGEDDAGHQPW